MATKQDIEAGIAVNMGGTVPSGHALAPIRQRLLDKPRERQWVIGQVVSKTTNIDHPADGEDRPAPTMIWVDMGGIADPADGDQLAAMLARARSQAGGQATLDEVTPGQPPEGGRPLAPVPDEGTG
jgi:hypothetical protein